MQQYLDLLKYVYKNGIFSKDRTGVSTISLFGTQTRYNLSGEFPLVTTKKVIFSSVVKELLWFLRGETNINTLGCSIWDLWADNNGELGPIYGHQWVNWGGGNWNSKNYFDGINQIKQVIESIKTNPYSRRHIVNTWNVSDLSEMALPPCHILFQFYVRNNELSCQLYQRSADLCLGVPFNIASYSLLTYMIANECGLKPTEFIHTIGDAHIYLNHIDGMLEQISRKPFPPPKLKLPPGKSTLEIKETDIILEEYNYHPRIKFPIAV